MKLNNEGLQPTARRLTSRTLIPLVLQNREGITVELHPHCNTGLGPLVALEAMHQGIQCLNTALPPLANGSSNPSLIRRRAGDAERNSGRALQISPQRDQPLVRFARIRDRALPGSSRSSLRRSLCYGRASAAANSTRREKMRFSARGTAPTPTTCRETSFPDPSWTSMIIEYSSPSPFASWAIVPSTSKGHRARRSLGGASPEANFRT